MTLAVVSPNPAAWAAYDRWCLARHTQAHRSEHAVFVAENPKEPRYLGACLLYPTDGPWAIAEHAATDPDAPLRLRHQAMVTAARHLRTYSALTGKTMVVGVRHRGILRCLERAGFRPAPGLTMLGEPWAWA